MTEDEARDWLVQQLAVSRETEQRLALFIDFLSREAEHQNLVSKSTLTEIWTRHIVDSAQLLKLLPDDSAYRWLDLGSGAGFPGLVVALLSDHEMTLVESRSKRIDYLKRAVSLLGLQSQITVEGMPIERVPTAPYSVISARAFAPLPKLFKLASRFSTDKTIWLLPKGRNAVKEWHDAQFDWTGDFRIEPSVTDPESGILVGRLAATGQQMQ